MTGFKEIQDLLLERCDYLSTDFQYHYFCPALTKPPMSMIVLAVLPNYGGFCTTTSSPKATKVMSIPIQSLSI